MIFPRIRRVMVALLLSIVLFTTACATQAPGRFDQVQQETQRGVQAVDKSATQGGSFNKYFPTSQSGFERVFTQEKKGFAQANLKKDGKVVAQLSVSDTSSVPTAAAKYANSDKKIAGYPAVQTGNTQTSILVGNRYQVTARSVDPSFTASDRAEWLGKFNLSGIANLKS